MISFETSSCRVINKTTTACLIKRILITTLIRVINDVTMILSSWYCFNYVMLYINTVSYYYITKFQFIYWIRSSLREASLRSSSWHKLLGESLLIFFKSTISLPMLYFREISFYEYVYLLFFLNITQCTSVT